MQNLKLKGLTICLEISALKKSGALHDNQDIQHESKRSRPFGGRSTGGIETVKPARCGKATRVELSSIEESAKDLFG